MNLNLHLLGNDLLLVINALSDKASSYRGLAKEIRDAIVNGDAHPSNEELAKHFGQQAKKAEQIRDALIADDEG